MPPLATSTLEQAGYLPPVQAPILLLSHPAPSHLPTQPATFGLHNHSHWLWGKMRCYSLNSNNRPHNTGCTQQNQHSDHFCAITALRSSQQLASPTNPQHGCVREAVTKIVLYRNSSVEHPSIYFRLSKCFQTDDIKQCIFF